MLARSHAVAQQVVVGLEVSGNGQPGPVWCPPVIRHGVDKQVPGLGARIVGGGHNFKLALKRMNCV